MMRELIFAAVFLCLVFPCSASPDYSSPDTWAYYAEGNGGETDLFIIAPTVDMGADGKEILSVPSIWRGKFSRIAPSCIPRSTGR